MEILILSLSLLLALIALIISLKKKDKNNNSDLSTKVDAIEIAIRNLSTNFRDDFRINREENAKIAKDNREELAIALKNITELSQSSLKEINATLSLKIDELLKKTDAINMANRNSNSQSLKEFSEGQKEKSEELKKELITMREAMVLELDKLSKNIQIELKELQTQAKNDTEKMRETLQKAFIGFQDNFDKNVKSFNDLQKEKFGILEDKQNKLVEGTEKKLEQMRETVDEKLTKTLNERLSKSFEQVGKQLESVQKGLGEMNTLAQDVGGLKRVLSNVKMRGGIGEVQLAMLLENILAPDQYEANVKTKKGSDDIVEFAIKLPGKDDGNQYVWLPIDAKFPKDSYEHLQDAYELADLKAIEIAQKNLDNTIRKMAKDVSTKYIDPPNTTDFAIIFLPFEGIYAEVVRKAALLNEMQRDYRVIITGPTTLAAILNSLQMGFKTLAIQKRSSEVWTILGAVKTEFGKFGGLLQKAQKNIQQGLNQLDQVSGTRTRAIERKLRDVQSISNKEANKILPDFKSLDQDENLEENEEK